MPSGFDLCAAHPTVLACASLPASSASADASGAVSAWQELVNDAKGRVPFAYVDQVATALDDAVTGAAGGASDYCFTIPQWFGDDATHDVVACVPLQDFADLAAGLRWVLLALLTVGFSVAMFRWISAAAPSAG
jgi:hypothetical protein